MKKEFDNGLSSLVSDSSVENNRKVMILINLKKWTQGVITILSLNIYLITIVSFTVFISSSSFVDKTIDISIA